MKLPSFDCILSKYETWSGFKINVFILYSHWDLDLRSQQSVGCYCYHTLVAQLGLSVGICLSISNLGRGGPPFNVTSAPVTCSIKQWSLLLHIKPSWSISARKTNPPLYSVSMWRTAIPMGEHYLNWHCNWPARSERNFIKISFLCVFPTD